MKEQTLGIPFKIYLEEKLIAQDLANSLLEFYSIREIFAPSPEERFTIAELGAGYGRHIIVDIPLTLHVAQIYLTRIFPV